MKKVIIIVAMILLIVLTGFTIIKGISIGGLSILGITQLNEKNDELDLTLKDATKLASTDYQKNINELNDKIKELDTQKTEYEDKMNVSTENQLNGINLINQPYKIEYLWVIIGNHAKTEGVEIKMDVAKSTSGSENYYNLNFTVTGLYISISEFITHIEDDSSLGFKIENFKMNSTQQSTTEQTNTGNKNETSKETITQTNGSDILQATFTCKDIKIQGISNNSQSESNSDTNNQVNSNTTENNTNETTNSSTNNINETV